MIYTDLEKIFSTTDIENKYALAMIVSARARQLSEQKGRLLGGEGSERCISYAIEEISGDNPAPLQPEPVPETRDQPRSLQEDADDDSKVGEE
ncbi:MAG: DNA-directed RNA polymerase subunit omega [Synergistaceae bacterium]|jgi:DNA-directed RNA polymerase subunit K/omega|nr:DNA-directed RNA polymerase subunit omega [Synergistaceae bacterium]